MDQTRFQPISTNGITLNVARTGSEEGPLLILLHGFPEFWYGWRKQLPALRDAGFNVWAPDQRGYNLSDKPTGLDAYNIDQLAADVVGLIDAAGRERALLVGHDWGAAVAWWAANKYPERIEKLAILNVPHHAVMRRALKQNARQRRRSWYMFYFQLPALPERSLRMGNWQKLVAAMQGSAHPGAFSDADMDAYRAAWGQPGAMTGMLNWYRAIFQRKPARLPSMRIKPPTLMIWGAQDHALGRELAQPSIDLCDDGRVVFLEDATHWVQHDEPAQVNQLLLDFLRPAPPAPPTSTHPQE
jgi:pimeloyl-ACP methyl ester carboxylesterase